MSSVNADIPRVTEVVVVGGGIAGLASAYALRRAGAAVTLVERAPEFGEVGAGLQLGPNATRVLKQWGLLSKVIDVGVIPGNLVFRDAMNGHEIGRQALDETFLDRYQAPYVLVHRSDLHRILVEAARDAGVTLITNEHIDRVETVGNRGIAYGAGGTTYEADLIVGADGLRSALRKHVSDDEPVRSGYVAFRGAFPAEEIGLQEDLEDVIVWVGPQCHFVQYGLRNGSVLNQVAVFKSPAVSRGEESGPEELAAAYASCVPAVQQAMTHIWTDRNWPMYDREPIEQWVDGRMVLLGDAAHPMLQYLAQGACQALEDADVLARLAARYVFDGNTHNSDGWPAAIEEFTAERTVRTAEVQRRARAWGESWHVDGIGRTLRNELFSRRDPSDFRYTDWLYAPRS